MSASKNAHVLMARRRADAFALYLADETYVEIARRLGVTSMSVWRYVRAEAAALGVHVERYHATRVTPLPPRLVPRPEQPEPSEAPEARPEAPEVPEQPLPAA